ncbi:hypothetical protein B0H13DRAFT_2230817 [Mycena leptocephala]|nr:hypothetical protein B0H13DRAFT_2230817 [Mycena leptocephala]
MTRIFLRYRLRCVLPVVVLACLILLTGFTAADTKLRLWRWRTSGGPPKYLALRRWEAALPQHNLSLPFPEGKTGRYVKFSNQAGVLGWNTYFNDVLMNAHLAYISDRAYVFQDYTWAPQDFQWPRRKWLTKHPHTPLNAIVSGPVAGGLFESDDPAPRAISQDWFDVVCPKNERHYIDINAPGVNPAVSQQASESGIEILTHWRTVLRDAPERCLEIVAPSDAKGDGDAFPQIFDPLLWKSPRILTLWASISQSPISRLLDASPIVGSAVARNTYLFIPRGPRPTHPAPRDPFQRMLAVHLRRGDAYEALCREMSRRDEGFYAWNLFPQLPDRFVSEPDARGTDERFLARCWPDQAGVIRKVAEVRRQYLVHATQSNATLDVVYILSNEKGRWIDGLKKMLQKDGWTVAASQDLVLDAEQKDVGMAVDMEIARRAAVFVGNGWSALTSNIVYQRLLDKRDPLSIRFT